MADPKDKPSDPTAAPSAPAVSPSPTPTVDSTVAPAEPLASGPSLQLLIDGDEVANLRVQTVHVNGEATGIDSVDAKAMKAEQGNVCVVTEASLRFGSDMLSQAVGSRGRMELELTRNDGEGKPLKGDFVVSRLSPTGMFNGEQLYTLVLENAGPEPQAEEVAE